MLQIVLSWSASNFALFEHDTAWTCGEHVCCRKFCLISYKFFPKHDTYIQLESMYFAKSFTMISLNFRPKYGIARRFILQNVLPWSTSIFALNIMQFECVCCRKFCRNQPYQIVSLKELKVQRCTIPNLIQN